MRVATNTYPGSIVGQLGSLAVRQAKLQTQAATGQRIQTADEDPASSRRILDAQTGKARAAQYQKNIANQQDLANASFNAIRGLKKISDRASEIATLSDGTKSPEQLKAYALEVDQLLKQALQLGNTRFGGSFIFGGTKSGQQPFSATNDASGSISAIEYNGNAETAELAIGESSFVSAQTLGAGNGGLITDAGSGADFFVHLISLRDHLQSADAKGIAEQDRPALAHDSDNFIYQIGTNGSLQTRLEAAGKLAQEQEDSLDNAVAKETGSDLAETLVQLTQANNAYQAALQSAGSLLRMSLLEYIR